MIRIDLKNRSPAPILVTVFNRNSLRLVRNETDVRNPTCFHRFYLDMVEMDKIDILITYLIMDVAQETFNDSSRKYGD